MNRPTKQQSPQTETIDSNPPESVGQVIERTKKTKPTKSQKEWFNCSKCNRACKTKASLAKHEASCDGDHKGGMPKGYMTPEKKELKDLKLAMQQKIAAKADRLITAQMALAVGMPRLWVREKQTFEVLNKNGKASKKTHWTSRPADREEDYQLYLTLEHNENGSAKDNELGVEFYYQQGTANNQAISNLLDRAFGKPKENVELGEDPDAPLPESGTGGTDKLRDAFYKFIMEKTKAPEKTDDTSN